MNSFKQILVAGISQFIGMGEEDFITVDSLRECTMSFFTIVECVWIANISKSLLSVLSTTL